MATYTYKEIERTLLACGFVEQKNNNGSHQLFLDEKTGFVQPLPKHSNGMIAPGTAESILCYAILVARLKNINICNDRYKLSKNVIDYIKKQHAKIKQNSIFLIPSAIRTQHNIASFNDAKVFMRDILKRCKLNIPKKLQQIEYCR